MRAGSNIGPAVSVGEAVFALVLTLVALGAAGMAEIGHNLGWVEPPFVAVRRENTKNWRFDGDRVEVSGLAGSGLTTRSAKERLKRETAVMPVVSRQKKSYDCYTLTGVRHRTHLMSGRASVFTCPEKRSWILKVSAQSPSPG